ncbi:heterokaryon incompatibility protein-domain-containing protein [Paraphoma chrysanthemicola]|uniref:Heterokaryon incompatibility protein-domain-containing protein n=1 Tax=Paraphoma chrysanthemicola TaxID=798071 RepID=A0A8K0QSZ0_9PLEO|nr:heterokaryon incompatibility protein-domain-containing protein [Paraphoma chrysanthemicola]
MRLLNSTTLEFKVFSDQELPEYGILSHTWGNAEEEVSYQELRFLLRLTALPRRLASGINITLVAALEAAAGLDFSATGRETISSRPGYVKIKHAASLAKAHGLDWVWIDTCCIDKSSSAELQEAINSMYRWYQLAKVCIVYLDDAVLGNNPLGKHPDFERMLRESKWITRGWTLQELIAPSSVDFYNASWSYIGSKQTYLSSIRGITGIPESVLATGDLSYASVAQKMAWAAKRKTSRVEDRAYSLLGIFGVHLPMLYGERENAFRRLQEEILRTTTDDSIFAWRAAAGGFDTYRGLLARSPEEFQDCRLASRGQGTFSISNRGLRVELLLRPLWDSEHDDGLYLGLLNATWGKDKRIAIVLRRLEHPNFARVSANELESWKGLTDHILDNIYVDHAPSLPPRFQTCLIHSIWFRHGSTEHSVPAYNVQVMRPADLSRENPPHILVRPRAFGGHKDFRVSTHRNIFIASVELRHRPTLAEPMGNPMHLLLGYNSKTGEYWCRILGRLRWPTVSASDEQWRSALTKSSALHEGDTTASFSTGIPHMRNINIRMYPAIQQDRSCLIVEIEGLHLASHGRP